MRITTRAAVSLAAVALVVAMSQSVLSAVDVPKLIGGTVMVRRTAGAPVVREILSALIVILAMAFVLSLEFAL